MTVLVEARDIGVRDGDRVLLDGVSLTLEAGRITTLIGPNGAGKTTLVRILLGLQQASTGSVGRSPGLRIGYMPQKLHIDPTLPITVAGFLDLANRDRQACRAALQRVEVEHLFHRPMTHLSGGETQYEEHEQVHQVEFRRGKAFHQR